MTHKLQLSLACNAYDRTRAIQDGSVRVEGADLTFIPLRVEETFFRQLRHQEFDISELSLSSYCLTLNNDDPPFVALPIFPSRFFRHQSIYISKKAGIKKPNEIKQKRVGIPEFQMTAPVWQRGILEEHHGVPFDSVEYFTGNLEPSTEPRIEKIDLPVIAGSVKITRIQPGKCLSQMLADGEIDALYSAAQPSSMGTSPNVDHLFPNFKQVEIEYYQKTKILPIMHLIVVKRPLLAANPWLARSITKAFNQALELSYEAIAERSALSYILPWLQDHVDECKRVFGSDRWWQDGLSENYHILDKFLDYHFRQGLSKVRRKPEDLFAKASLERFVI